MNPSSAYSAFSTRRTSQREAIPGKVMVPNSAGGQVYTLDDLKALERFLTLYRERTGIPTKSIVVGMTATDFTIADPQDAGSLDVVGFDTSTPSVMSEFVR